MKNIYKLFLVTAFVTAGTLFQSCETLELENTNNPNNLTSGDPSFLLNSIQSAYRATQVTLNDRSSELTRIDYMFGRNYFSNYGAATMNGSWSNLYSSILPNIAAIEAAQTEDNDLRMHIAMGKIMQAHIMMQIVDFIGDIVPLDQATNPLEFPTPEPTSDGGAAAYDSAMSVLDDAIALLGGADLVSVGGTDLYYGGDANAWIKLANTLKMRAYVTTGNSSGFNSIVNTGNFISSNADDFQFNFGTQLAPVNTQHQDYQNDYTSSGANIYQSNWLMNLMLNNDDPRIRYYYYRQSGCTPGASCDPAGNGETLQCSLQAVPPHLQGTPTADIWCFMEAGYWGRLHGNDEGTPPDNFTRTAAGTYPAGGNFDGDRFRTGKIELNNDTNMYEFVYNGTGVNLGQGSNGAGIEPIVLASYVDFWRAEMALAGGNPTGAAMHMANGLTKSMDKVRNGVVDASFDGGALLDDTTFNPVTGDPITAVLASTLVPADSDFTDYVTNMENAFLAASSADQWNILGEQYFTTMYGGGADAHNFYRRTGAPTTVADNTDPAPGNYPRTFLFPANEVSVNPNFTQRLDNNDAVFWNTQPLPVAN